MHLRNLPPEMFHSVLQHLNPEDRVKVAQLDRQFRNDTKASFFQHHTYDDELDDVRLSRYNKLITQGKDPRHVAMTALRNGHFKAARQLINKSFYDLSVPIHYLERIITKGPSDNDTAAYRWLQRIRKHSDFTRALFYFSLVVDEGDLTNNHVSALKCALLPLDVKSSDDNKAIMKLLQHIRTKLKTPHSQAEKRILLALERVIFEKLFKK